MFIIRGGILLCVESVVDILLDGGAWPSVSVRNRKNLLPTQLTHNINILQKLLAAELQHQIYHDANTASTATAIRASTAVSLVCLL